LELYNLFINKKNESSLKGHFYFFDFVDNKSIKNDSIIKNMNLIYNKNTNLIKEFIFDDETKNFEYSSIEELDEIITKSIRKYKKEYNDEVSDDENETPSFLFYTYRDETAQKLNNYLLNVDCLHHFEGEKEDIVIYNLYQKYFKDERRNKYKIGELIKNKKNHKSII
jgi:hypothetical protein